MFNVKDRVIVITGGYGVLGASMARCLSELGAHVVIVGRKAEKGEALVSELSALGAEALFCKLEKYSVDHCSAAGKDRPAPNQQDNLSRSVEKRSFHAVSCIC